MTTEKHPRSGMRVLHARYGQGRIRTIVSNYLEIDFDDGKRRYLKNSGYIKLNPGPDEGVDPNLINFPESPISRKIVQMQQERKEKEFMTEKIKEKDKANGKTELQVAKAAIRDELKKKTNKELRSLCAQHEVQYNKYSKLPDGLKRMNIINCLSAKIAKATLG